MRATSLPNLDRAGFDSVLLGGNGDDTLTGGAGSDAMTGGGGERLHVTFERDLTDDLYRSRGDRRLARGLRLQGPAPLHHRALKRSALHVSIRSGCGRRCAP